MTEGVYLVAMVIGGLAFCGLLLTAIVAIYFGRGTRLSASGRVRDRDVSFESTLDVSGTAPAPAERHE